MTPCVMTRARWESARSAATIIAVAWIGLFISSVGWPRISYCQTSFYQGKTITMVVGTEPGGSQDFRTKAVISFLRKHIPGNPTIVPEYMPGGGGMKSANYLYTRTKSDGLIIGSPGSTIVDNAILNLSGVRYDLGKFIFLGAPITRQTTLFMTRKELGLTSIEKLQAAEGLRIPGQAVGHSVHIGARLFAWLLDLNRPKFVLGYSTSERDVAFRQGEADVKVRTASVIQHNFPDYLKKRLVDFHAALDHPRGVRDPAFDFLPELDGFARNEKEEKVLKLSRAALVGGTPFVLPPGTPTEAVKILQDAIRKTFNDPEFHKEFRQMSGDDPTPLLPEDHEKAIKEIPREPEVVELYKRIAGVDPLPAR
jgi:tripartite-type tricarboxylate transporter receptor subunit TctC